MSSTAEEMLSSLTEEEIAAYTANPEEERHIIVDETRKITVPDELKRIAVQYDHNIETVTFDCIRYWDGHDMSTMHVYINYMLANKALGCYMSEDVTVDPNDENIIHFTWTISRNVTQAIGPITFLVCIKRVDEEGNEVNHWNSELNKEMFVNQGLECGEPITEDYPDIIEQILLKLESQDKYPAWRRWTDASGSYTNESGMPYGVKLMDESNNAPGSWSIAGGYNTTASGICSASLGNSTTASGIGSVAFGLHSNASGDSSVAFGNYTQAIGHRSVAFGENTKAIVDNQLVVGRYNVPESNQYAFVIGNGTADALKNALAVDWDGNLGLSGGITSLNSSDSVYNNDGIRTGLLALGGGNKAIGSSSVAMGGGNTASGLFSVAMGSGNNASGAISVAMGEHNYINGAHSVTIGKWLTTDFGNQTVIGRYNDYSSNSIGSSAFVIGNGTDVNTRSNAMTVDWDGNLKIAKSICSLNMGCSTTGGGLIALGGGNTASGAYSVAIGAGCRATGQHSLAFGGGNTASGIGSVAFGTGNNTASNSYSISIGTGNTASATYSVAIGSSNTANGPYSVDIGYNCHSYADFGFAIGANCTVGNENNTTSGMYSAAIGAGCRAQSSYSMTFGASCTVSGDYSFAGGASNNVSGSYSVAMGELNRASGKNSVSIGKGLIAVGDNQTALGRYNVDETEFDMRNLFVLGNGTDANNRSNAMAVDVAGNLNMNRDVVANAFGDSPISLVELSNRIGVVEEKLAKLVTPEGSV